MHNITNIYKNWKKKVTRGIYPPLVEPYFIQRYTHTLSGHIDLQQLPFVLHLCVRTYNIISVYTLYYIKQKTELGHHGLFNFLFLIAHTFFSILFSSSWIIYGRSLYHVVSTVARFRLRTDVNAIGILYIRILLSLYIFIIIIHLCGPQLDLTLLHCNAVAIILRRDVPVAYETHENR